jgi:hypothetical protein
MGTKYGWIYKKKKDMGTGRFLASPAQAAVASTS